jgi:hypothetical protein
MSSRVNTKATCPKNLKEYRWECFGQRASCTASRRTPLRSGGRLCISRATRERPFVQHVCSDRAEGCIAGLCVVGESECCVRRASCSKGGGASPAGRRGSDLSRKRVCSDRAEGRIAGLCGFGGSRATRHSERSVCNESAEGGNLLSNGTARMSRSEEGMASRRTQRGR